MCDQVCLHEKWECKRCHGQLRVYTTLDILPPVLHKCHVDTEGQIHSNTRVHPVAKMEKGSV